MTTAPAACRPRVTGCKGAYRPDILDWQSPTERGLTLVELMVAMTVSSILILFMLGAKTQLSQAFRGQSIASDVGSNLRMAAGALRRDLAHAGYLLPGGAVEVAPGVDLDGLLQGISVRNNAHGTGSDELYMLFADDGRLARLDGFPAGVSRAMLETEDDDLFEMDEILILGAPSAACLVQVAPGSASPGQISVNPSQGPFNDSGHGGTPNPHCINLEKALNDGEPSFIYSFIGRGYRIDPDRPELGVLQISPSAGLVPDDWQDVGVGFTNLQVAVQYYEEDRSDPADDLDGSGDPQRNWYSGDNQENPPPGARPIAISLSLEARSLGEVQGSPTRATPAFIDLERPDHNPFGDWGGECPGAELDPCGIDLAGTSDAERPERYRGDHIYRWTTITVSLRNMQGGEQPVPADPGDDGGPGKGGGGDDGG